MILQQPLRVTGSPAPTKAIFPKIATPTTRRRSIFPNEIAGFQAQLTVRAMADLQVINMNVLAQGASKPTRMTQAGMAARSRTAGTTRASSAPPKSATADRA